MPRSIWKGSVSFGLVQIPVDVYPAESADELSFTMLDSRDLAPVGYERVNKKTGARVPWDAVVKGYEHEKDSYVVVTDEELKEANVEATHTLDIVGFVDLNEIDAIYFEKPYYLMPNAAGGRAYQLLVQTLTRKNKAGIGKIVLRTRQHIGALVAKKGILMLILLRYADELRAPASALPGGKAKGSVVDAREIQMAEQLVDGMAMKWNAADYEDEFRHDVMKLIEKKVEAGEVNQLPAEPSRAKAENTPATRAVDLMELLKKSIAARPANHPQSSKVIGKKPKIRRSA